MRSYALSALFSLSVCASTLSASLAHAQEPSAQARAVEFYEAGLKAAFAGDYGEAIFEFKQGHQLAPNGLFTYNITIAYLKTQNYADALTSARESEQRHADLNAEQRAKNLARIRAILARQRTMDVAEDMQVRRDLEKQDLSPPDTVILTPQPSAAEPRGLGAVGWSGLGLVVTGGGLMAGSLYYSQQIKGLQVGEDEDGRPTVAPENKEEADLALRRGRILLLSGGGVTLLGLGLFAYGLGSRNKPKRSSALELQLAPSRTGGAIGFTYTF